MATGKNWKQTTALAAGGFVTGATLGLGGVAMGAAGGVSTLGITGTTYISLASGITGGLLGNATEQGIKMSLGEQNNFDSDELIMNGVFGMSEILLGPSSEFVSNKAKNSIKDALQDSFKTSKAEVRQAKNNLAKQLRSNAPFKMSKKQSIEAANKLIKEAIAHESNVLQGTIRASQNGIDVTVSAITTTISEETKNSIPKSN